MTILLGIDAGGTKTVAAVTDGTRELARASGAAGAVRPGRAMAAAGTIATVARRALAQAGLLRADILVVGAAGVGREEERQALRDALRIETLAEQLIVTTDIEIAIQSAFGNGPGIVLLAGTGSFAVGHLPDGRIARQGGHGWQMGDDGSAYALGRAALVAAGRGHDGRAPHTALEEALVQATRARDFNDLVRWSVVAGPPEIAALAPVVLDAAAAGDSVAQSLRDAAVTDLVAQVTALLPRYGGMTEVMPVALAGGLLERDGLRAPVTAALRVLPGVALQETLLDPVQGALALAATKRGQA
jgi:glucosamine kinase